MGKDCEVHQNAPYIFCYEVLSMKLCSGIFVVAELALLNIRIY